MEQEGRWLFHPIQDLPAPRIFEKKTSKVYPSGNPTGTLNEYNQNQIVCIITIETG